MRNVIKTLIFILLFFSNVTICLFSNEITQQKSSLFFLNQDVLRSFFKNLLENTSAGYVIYGEKPIYLGSFCQPECWMPGSNEHKEAICTFLSLKALPHELMASNYILVSQGLQDLASESNEFILINQKAFLKVVKENLVLFKYKLGHTITPETLFEKLVDPRQGFSKLFKSNMALQGIVLGYGTNNSISFERVSPFGGASSNPSSPPNQLPPPPKTEEEMISRLENNAKNNGSWGQVKEEIKDISYYCSKDSDDKLKIPFSFHQNSEETRILFQKYRKAESKVSRVLKDQDFPKNILKKLKIHRKIPAIQKENYIEMLTLVKREMISQILARSIQNTFSMEISPEFIEGMRSANSHCADITKEIQGLDFFEILRKQGMSNANLRNKGEESREFLQKIASHPDVRCLIPKKLYFHILKHGNQEKFITSKHKIIKANYIIKDINGNIISGVYKSQTPATLNLENLIPGLAHGILGMNEGEVRVVFIHPDFAYGMYSEFGSGKALQIQVELTSIEKPASDDTAFPSLQPVDVIYFAPKIESIEEFKALQKRFNYLCGMKTWLHYKKAGEFLHLDWVIEGLESNNTSFFDKRREDEIIAILNWIIYQKF